VATLANPTFQNMLAAEQFFMTTIGSFLKELTGLKVFITNKPWPSGSEPMIGIRILSYDKSGWGSKYGYDETNNQQIVEMTSIPTVEFLAVRGNPVSTLNYVNNALMSFNDYCYNKLTLNGIGFLSATSVSEADTVFDQAQTEFRARMLGDFTLRLRIFDQAVNLKVEKVSLTQNFIEEGANTPSISYQSVFENLVE
jgi:hypothetical protein